MTARNRWLVAGGSLSLAASGMHIACIFGGPDWYRFFGAGEPVARAAERGSPIPAAMAATIALLLGIAAAYAFSGAGLIRRLPLLRTALVTITAVYVARGLVVAWPSALGRTDLSANFILWSSLVVLAFGVVHFIGTWQSWPAFSQGTTN